MIDQTKVIKGLGEALVLLAEYVPGERYLGYAPGACLDAIEMLKAHVLSVDDILENRAPDVIWVELRDDTKVTPGLWVISSYEMQDGSVLGDLGEEIAADPEAYNSKWRVWDKAPTDEEREMASWAEKQG